MKFKLDKMVVSFNAKAVILLVFGSILAIYILNSRIWWLQSKFGRKYDGNLIPGLHNLKRIMENYESGFDWSKSRLCPNTGIDLDLFIFVMSAPQNKEWRDAIRKTWGSLKRHYKVSSGFMIGHTLNETIQNQLIIENKVYDDLIMSKLYDNYYNLTFKTISMLEWAVKKCGKVKFILKIDDDVFLNMENLLKLMEKYHNASQKIFGQVLDDAVVFRDRKSKYYVHVSEYEPAIFPQYTAGPAYLITGDIIHELLEKAMDAPFFKFEDVHVTGFLATQLLNIDLVDVTGFNYESPEKVLHNACYIKNEMISYHKCNIKDIFDIWKKVFIYESLPVKLNCP